jgi:hypothetical protein
MSEIPLYKNRQLYLVFALAFVLCLAGPAGAVTYTYTFDAITQNDPTGANAAAGEAQLRMDVSEGPNSNQVTFTFYHIGTTPMSITDIYFYDGVLGLSGTTFSGFIANPAWNDDSQSGVKFTVGAEPPALPGANTLLPRSSVVFSYDSDTPIPLAGVNPGESLGIKFTLGDNKNINDVISALKGWIRDGKFDSGDLVVGLHVQAINTSSSESSESFVVAPLPPSLLLLGSGLAGLTLALYRRRRKTE